MPPDRTYRNLNRLHMALAGSSLALLAVTLWALLADPRPNVEQILLPELAVDGHFGPVPRLDRCTTCHQGIDLPADSGAPVGREALRRPHPRLDLFVGPRSPHSQERFGCTVCHEGQGSATEFRWASHTPNDSRQAARWRQQYGWSDNPRWDRPMLPLGLVQSACVKCHHEVTDLEPTRRISDPPAARLVEGYRLVRQLGCFGCHEIRGVDPRGNRIGPDLRSEPETAADAAPPGGPRKVGPTLRHVAQKVDAAYLAGRLRNPFEFLPSTRMPQFYGMHAHLDRQSEETARRREAAEIDAIVEYLMTRSQPRPPPPPPPGVTEPPSPRRGKRLFSLQGCLACHQHGDWPQCRAVQGPDLTSLGRKYRDPSGAAWLVGWIRQPSYYRPNSIMPGPMFEPAPLPAGRISDPAADIAAYLLKDSRQVKRSPPPPASNPAIFELGRASIARRGCSACHDIPGFDDPQPIGPALSDWGRKPESLLGFDHVAEYVERTDRDQGLREALGQHRRDGFLLQKLRDPRSFDFGLAAQKDYNSWLTMGRFNLTDAQRQAIMTFILGLVAEPPPEPYLYRPGIERQALARGRKVLDKYACGGCHVLELDHWLVKSGGRRVELTGTPRVDTDGKLFVDEDERGEPLYWFTPWEAANFDKRIWRVGGPDVPVSRAQIVGRRPAVGGDLARLLYPLVLAQARADGLMGPENEIWGWLPPPLAYEGIKVQRPWLGQFLLRPHRIRPSAVLRMPQFSLSPAEAEVLVDYFGSGHTGWIQRPSDAGETLNIARLDAAMKIVLDDKNYCARCHSLGDSGRSGAAGAVLGPNLEEVGERIQPKHIRRWLADPKSITPYTAMPVNFPPDEGGRRGGGFKDAADTLDAVADLLIHYGWYLRHRTSIDQRNQASGPSAGPPGSGR